MLVTLQEQLLAYTSLVYLVVTCCYIVYLGKRLEPIGRVAVSLGVLGAVLHTLGLTLRWIAGGIEHPPFTNLYESLVFFAWGIVVFYLYMEFRYKVRIAGAFVFPIALAAMGIAVTHQKGIMPLPDALKSWWLHIHVMFAAIAYAAFVVSFAFSVMFLIKDKVNKAVFGIVVSTITSVLLMMVQLRAGTAHVGKFFLSKAVFKVGRWMPVMVQGANPPEYHSRPIPVAGPLIIAAAVLLLLATIIFLIYLLRRSKYAERIGGFLLLLGSISLSAAVSFIVYFSVMLPDTTLILEPFLFSLLCFLCISCWGVVLIYYRSESLMERFPTVDMLDFLSYRSVIVAFPMMSIVIVTGAVWAQSAWGRWWGWDPKETASLVTWFVYALYLHMRIVSGWKGRPSAVINIIGFLSVVFTYLGVNIFLSGLHSYASSF